MPPPTRLELLLQLVPPDRVPALTLALNRYGITNEDAVELLLVLLFVDLDHILAKIPGTLAQTVSDIPAHVEAAIDAKIGDVAQTLAGAVNAATLSARGQIDDLRNTLQGRVAAAVNAGIQPTLVELERILAATKESVRKAGDWQISAWREQEQAVQAGLKELTAKIALINRITAEDKQAVVHALADWHRDLAAQLATSGTDAIAQFDTKITTVGTDLLTKTTAALKDAENAQSALSKKYLAALKKQEEVLSRTNRFGLAVLAGFAVVFLAGGFLAASWWQSASYQDTLSRTIQLYESKLPPGQQVIPASVGADAAKLRDFLNTKGAGGHRP